MNLPPPQTENLKHTTHHTPHATPAHLIFCITRRWLDNSQYSYVPADHPYSSNGIHSTLIFKVMISRHRKVSRGSRNDLKRIVTQTPKVPPKKTIHSSAHHRSLALSSQYLLLWSLLFILSVLLFYFGPIGERVISTPANGINNGAGSSLPQLQDVNSDFSEEGIFTAFSRPETTKLKDMRLKFQYLEATNSLTPCRLDQDCHIKENTFWFPLLRGHAAAAAASSMVLLRNTLPFHRHFCGKTIWGSGGVVEVTSDEMSRCLASNSYVYSAAPPSLSGEGMPPIELFWNFETPGQNHGYADDQMSATTFETEDFKCSIPCRKLGEFAILSIVSVKDTNWEILSTMEGERYYGQARVNRKSYLHDQFYATTSFQSEIPLPYFSWAEYDIQHSAVDFDKAIKGASFIANNCDSDNRREEVVLGLLNTRLRIDSLSGCHHNTEPPFGMTMENKTAVLQQYLFYLAFENQNAQDYITEKLWGALAAGTLPVYLGAPNIKEHIPAKSVVIADDFSSTEELGEFLVKLSQDRTLYESYHAWRYKPIDPFFQQKYQFTKTHSTCRICKWAYSKKLGLGWNHENQEITEPHIPHRTCRNKAGLIGHPFKEYWSTEPDDRLVPVYSDKATKTCTLHESNRILIIDNGAYRREVFDRDGITDLHIKKLLSEVGPYRLKLETPIAALGLREIEENTGQEWWLQDEVSRLTILFSQPVKLHSVGPGTIQLAVSSDLRVRLIVEDLDLFHKGAKKHPSYFGRMMTRDFFTPIEAYRFDGVPELV